MYVQNRAATAVTCNFISGSPNAVITPVFGGLTNTFPEVGGQKTNLYEFTKVHTGIFAEYKTGYIF